MLSVPYGEEMHCTAPTGFAIKKHHPPLLFFALFTLPKGNNYLHSSACCSKEKEREREKKKLIANEPL